MPVFDPASIDRYAGTIENQNPSSAYTQSAPKKSAGVWPYISIAAANAADIGTSLYDQHHYGTHEANPLLIDTPSLIGLKAATAAMQMGLVHELSEHGHPTAAKWLGYLSSVPPAAAAVSNMRPSLRNLHKD